MGKICKQKTEQLIVSLPIFIGYTVILDLLK